MEYYDDMPERLKILIISYYFPPSSAVGAVRANALYKYLIKNGYHVDIFSFNENDNIKNENKSNSNGLKLSRLFRSIDRTILSSFIFIGIKKLNNSKGKYDLVISSYKPVASIILGIYHKLINKKSILFIELRDLVSQFGRKRKVFPFHFLDSVIDRFFISFADELIVVSPTSKKKAELFYKRKVNLILNGIDFKKNYFKEPSEKIRILYSGTLSEVRNLKLICSHINSNKKEIVLTIASKQDPSNFYGDYKFINYLGFISREKLEQEIKKSDFLLILEGFDKDSEENIPAKIFEYLGYNKPIMANCSPNSEIVKILNETGAGKNVNNYNDFENFVCPKNFKVNNKIKKYYRENQFKKYLELIEK